MIKTPNQILNAILKQGKKLLLIKRILFLMFGISGTVISSIVTLNLLHIPSVISAIPAIASALLLVSITYGVEERKIVQILKMSVEQLQELKAKLEDDRDYNPFDNAPDNMNTATTTGEVEIEGQIYEIQIN